MKSLLREITLLEKRASATAFDELDEGIEKIEEAIKHLPSADSMLISKFKEDLKQLQKHRGELERQLLDATWDLW